MMATIPWNQGSQPAMQNNGYYQQPGPQAVQQPVQQPIQRRKTNPPPVCFNCGVEGHFLVACPEATRNTPGGFAPAPGPYQQAPGPNPQSQPYFPQGGPLQQVPGPNPQNQPYLPQGGSIQQAPGPIQQNQPYAPQGGPVQHPSYQPTPQYGNAGQQYSYNQPQSQPPQQPYVTSQQYGQPQQYGQTQQYGQSQQYGQPQQYAQPLQNSQSQQYGQPGYQPAPYNHPSSSTPQFNPQGYQGPPQQFAPVIPVPYQQPQNPYPPQNPGYGAPYQAPSAPFQPPQQQYNNQPGARAPYQQQQRRNSSYRGSSGTPSNPLQRQRSQSQQITHTSKPVHQTPQTPASVHSSARHASRRGSMITPDGKLDSGSKASSRASTPYGRYVPAGDTPMLEINTAPTLSASQNYDQDKTEDGEVGEAEGDEAMFNWEFKQIFKEPARCETVELAQPLSANFKSTPVPLVQAWSTNVPSVSRYARKDNLKEFVRPIRELPQWSYLQEDPAFADVNLDGPSISLEELPSWVTLHHRQMSAENEALFYESFQDPISEPVVESSRKRRSDEVAGSSQAYTSQVNGGIKIEGSSDQEDGSPRTKRLKTVAGIDEDDMMQIPTARTPVIGFRAGTPCIETEGDAWVPEPGETASTPQDPTEAHLASLGVTGSPKPVKKEPVPAYMHDLEEQPRQSQPSKPPAETHATANAPPSSQPVNAPPMNNHTPSNIQHGHPLNSQQGPPVNLNGQNSLPANATHHQGPPMPMQHQQGPPTNHRQGFPPQQPYGAPMNGPYPNGQTAGPSYSGPSAGNFPQGNQQHGYQERTSAYGNASYASPANVPPYANAPPPQENYGPPNSFSQQGQPQWGTQNQPYSQGPLSNAPQSCAPYPQQQTAPFVNPQYTPAPYQNTPNQYHPQGPSQHGRNPSMPGNYGPPTQASQTQYLPPHNEQNMYPQSAPQPQYNQGPGGQYGVSNGLPQNGQIPNGLPQQPFRQDSGYMSARGSYSNDGSHQGFNTSHGLPSGPPFHMSMDGASSPKPEPPTIGADIIGSQEMTREDSDEGSRATSSTGTSLSPTSMEILGKLERRSSKSGDKKKAKEAARKAKRPQPVVAEAYSRRW